MLMDMFFLLTALLSNHLNLCSQARGFIDLRFNNSHDLMRSLITADLLSRLFPSPRPQILAWTLS